MAQPKRARPSTRDERAAYKNKRVERHAPRLVGDLVTSELGNVEDAATIIGGLAAKTSYDRAKQVCTVRFMVPRTHRKTCEAFLEIGPDSFLMRAALARLSRDLALAAEWGWCPIEGFHTLEQFIQSRLFVVDDVARALRQIDKRPRKLTFRLAKEVDEGDPLLNPLLAGMKTYDAVVYWTANRIALGELDAADSPTQEGKLAPLRPLVFETGRFPMPHLFGVPVESFNFL